MSEEETAAAYATIITTRLGEGWRGYLITFLFNQLAGNDREVRQQQLPLVETVYSRLLTRVVRRPAAPSQAGRLPVWVGAPDVPIHKLTKVKLDATSPNRGWHYHAVCAMPPWGRKVQDLEAHFHSHHGDYVEPGALRFVEARLITHDAEFVCDYILKAIRRGTITLDDIVLLPRARSEMIKHPSGGRDRSCKS